MGSFFFVSNGCERLELHAVCVCTRARPAMAKKETATVRWKARFMAAQPTTGYGHRVRIKKIDHVAVAVTDVDAACAKYKEVLGLEPTVREVVESQKTEAVLLPIGETSIELISPR